ncbi:proprotein convertase subtilisin/kexin type 1 inhibitor, like isoform X2 [Electrophorus electricus]|uniref:proprotein convertase subtilisin/kexin type 1 inhibitor, like isoform X2 n=1 Tax=Electrophorus electricus TaxID=8005 RepID=UPI0015CF9FB9|nr:proprotein convertase subtilisin/kexin type 1 inhibitor, like isoform X2 [Electrophorus electricus]
MSGPWTSSVLLLISVAFLQSPLLDAKPLSAVHGGGAARLRRDLRDSLPYEAQMMSYAPADFKGRGNDLYYQPDALRAQELGQAIQRLVENDQKWDHEAAYLAGLLRLLSEAENNGQGKREEEEEGEEGDFQGPYPPDYDETEQTLSIVNPQALLDPQLSEALLNRYRQERLLQTRLGSAAGRVPESGQQQDQEELRYLVKRILSSLASGNQLSPSNRRAKRDVSGVAGIGQGGATTLRRARRSLDSVPVSAPNAEASLIRVKRLGEDDDDDEGFGSHSNRSPRVGLQRMKRIDTDLTPPQKHSPAPVSHEMVLPSKQTVGMLAVK